MAKQSFVHRALALIGTPDALDHLANVGAYYQLSQVGDPRAAEIAAARLRDGDYTTQLAAARLLAGMPDSRWVPDLLGAYDQATSDELRVSTLGALEACGASEEVSRRAPDLLDGPYRYAAQAILIRLTARAAPLQASTTGLAGGRLGEVMRPSASGVSRRRGCPRRQNNELPGQCP